VVAAAADMTFTQLTMVGQEVGVNPIGFLVVAMCWLLPEWSIWWQSPAQE